MIADKEIVSNRWLNCHCFLVFGRYCPINDDARNAHKQYCGNCQINRQINERWGRKFTLPSQYSEFSILRGRLAEYDGHSKMFPKDVASLFYLRNTKFPGVYTEHDMWFSNEEAFKHQGFFQLLGYGLPKELVMLIWQRLVYIVLKDVRLIASFSHPSDIERPGILLCSENKVEMTARGYGHLFKRTMLNKIK